MKNWGDPTTISFNDCMVCLVQGVTTIPLARGERETPWRQKKLFNYNSIDSFSYEEILFDDIKEFGFAIMHKYIRCTENVCHLAEAKYAKTNHFDLYINNKTRPDAMALARSHFQKDFRDRLGIKYYVPDPKNGA
jgi:hypothetical protein